MTLSQATREDWNEIGRKLIAMAEDFPDDKYDFKPTPAQRSFAEQLLHVAGSNDLFTAVAKGQKPVDDEDRSHYKTKAAVVAYVKKSFAEGAEAIQAKGDSGMLQMVIAPESRDKEPLVALAYQLIEHSGEHYGQLVVYYRVAGMVPPESRPQK
ncbi:MAG TPA: DinB family protein [Terriglobales bacterium]|nr:DinB family protein [Terriglobales bacterium]